MTIRKETLFDLEKKMEALGIQEDDLVEKFILGSGRGGQKIQKTSSCVYLKHLPTGIEIKCQKDRLREKNRYFARKELCRKIEYLLHQRKSEQQQKIEKIRRQKRKRSKRAQEKVLQQKKHLAEKKQLRRTPTPSE